MNPAELFASEENPILLAAGETLFRAGDPADAMYVLLSGMAGALLVSRAVDDAGLSDRILRAARRFYRESFVDSVGNSVAQPVE